MLDWTASCRRHFGWLLFTLVACGLSHCEAIQGGEPLEPIRVSDDGTHFIRHPSGSRFVVWGVNYDHDSDGKLIDEYWEGQWERVAEDFQEIRALGANCVRIHLQLGKFMRSPKAVDEAALRQLKSLVELAEQTGVYLDITGLACYHRANIPGWYDALSESERWDVQANFWGAVARTCQDSPAVFCYDLMNEPILPGVEPATEWLAGELGGKFFVQRLALELGGRSRSEIANAWAKRMRESIRRHDSETLITVGVIPWVFVFGGGQPLFYSPPVAEHFDFVSVHFYPKTGEVDKALEALAAYDVGKPLVVEEMFPLKCSADELQRFIAESETRVDGWISFYWGTPAAELRDGATIAEAITAEWLDRFAELSARYAR